jgi:hypothetical protein
MDNKVRIKFNNLRQRSSVVGVNAVVEASVSPHMIEHLDKIGKVAAEAGTRTLKLLHS